MALESQVPIAVTLGVTLSICLVKSTDVLRRLLEASQVISRQLDVLCLVIAEVVELNLDALMVDIEHGRWAGYQHLALFTIDDPSHSSVTREGSSGAETVVQECAVLEASLQGNVVGCVFCDCVDNFAFVSEIDKVNLGTLDAHDGVEGFQLAEDFEQASETW